MILDKAFKKLDHNCKGYKTYKTGGILEPGYKPDYVLKKNNEYIIIESENSSSRKTFIGGMIKAAHFLNEEKKGILVYVIVPKKNTSILSIALQIRTYYSWIMPITNLSDILIIEVKNYFDGIKVLEIGTQKFQKMALSVKGLDGKLLQSDPSNAE